MSLSEIVDNSRTDKNTIHSYLPLYEKLFSSKKETAKNVLEIGVTQGGSIKLWSEYFVNATIYGLDNIDINNIPQDIQNNKNIILHTSINAYDETFVKEFADKNLKIDIIIDDGSHKLTDMKHFIQFYSPLLTNDGILIIEDVQSIDWIEELKKEVPEELKEYVFVYDLREKKGRYDDIVFVINKLKLCHHYCYRYAYEDVKTSHALEK
jgi:cephalosporin hydroxylase